VNVNASETATVFESLTFAETPTKKAGVSGTGIWAFAGVVAICGVIALRRK